MAETSSFSVNEFKPIVDDLVRPSLFDMNIEGFDHAKLLIHTVDLMNGLPHRIKMYERSDSYVHTMLDKLQTETEAGKKFAVTLTQYKPDGEPFKVSKYELSGVVYETKLSWDLANKVQEYEVYVELEKA